MQGSVFIRGGGVVVSAYGIAGTKTLPLQRGLEYSDKPTRDLHEPAQCALIACGGGVDQDPALNWLPWNRRQHVETLFQCAGRVSAIDCDLGHQGVPKTVRHHILGPLAFAEAVLAH